MEYHDLYQGDTEEHTFGDPETTVAITPFWDDEEIVKFDIDCGNGAERICCEVDANEITTWLRLRWPEHFRADGGCRCGAHDYEIDDTPALPEIPLP